MTRKSTFPRLLLLSLALALILSLAQASEAPDQARAFDPILKRLQDFASPGFDEREFLPWHPDEFRLDQATLQEMLSRQSETMGAILDRLESKQPSAEHKDEGMLGFERLALLSLNQKINQSTELMTSYIRRVSESMSNLVRQMD